MNIKFDFTETGGLPLDQDILNDLQNGILESEITAALAGPLAILSGCVIAGPNAGNGIVAINGEILPFVGGTITDKVIIVQTTTPLTYEDGAARPSQITRIATFGDDGVEDNLWVNFVRNSPEGVIADIDSLNTDVATIGAEITAIEAAMVTKLASGTATLGDADTNHSDSGDGTLHTISLGVTLTDINYLVLYSIVSLSSDAQNDLYHQVVVRTKRTNSFDIYFREVQGLTQNIKLDWMVVKL